MIVGIDAGSPDARSAEHVLAGILDLLGENAVRFGCTHLTRTGGPHVVLSLEVVDASVLNRLPPELRPVPLPQDGTVPEGAAVAGAIAHRDRSSGRAVCFPGQERLTGVLTARELVALSAIDRVWRWRHHRPAAPTTPDVRGCGRLDRPDGT